ncbi:MAG: chaperonin GroES [Candidatus Woesearchaeota archaeon]|nr:chaperonin GroES [Candidatus Woesearchaeota archaeon]MDK2908168.1 chaperonin GroES [Candidatus Woesearchaeota archaeon]
MKIRILGPRVLLKPTKKEEKTKGGLLIPDSAKDDNKEGEVIEVGSYDIKDKEMPVKKGDKVIYSGFSNNKINIDGEDYYVVDVKDILAVVEERR